MKKLAIISSNRIIGTISLGGNINDNRETLDAEKPKPLNPRTKEAKRITLQKKTKFSKLRFIKLKNSINFIYLNRIIPYIYLIKMI